ncbi:autotransporter secretion outer membrane protein TamA [Roseivivax lentus]|uniref:Autotransporter secretion outer membrane protein TamA n=1 Tax=Roseivivax lentus TaxID=633194 RepID=A0A1N7KDH5_9RHOB|nr:autotransporter assembly complex family protein [Roseivivax lentus]SIS59666.1 autotransporter secretion outer membrane protein TamA [Roseivivax lentus]
MYPTRMIPCSIAGILSSVVFCLPAFALSDIDIRVDAPSEAVQEDIAAAIEAASSLVSGEAEGLTTPQEVAAAALSDYANVVGVLYDQGYFSGVVSIELDGREASEIELLALPEAFRRGVIRVQTGPRFTFRETTIAPVHKDTELPEGFAPGEVAKTAVVRDAVSATIEGWRQEGYAKARTASESATAFHDAAELAIRIGIDQGPRVRFGEMILGSQSAVRPAALRRIAGFPEGQRFDPDDVTTVTGRLRATGAFSSVTLSEAETVAPDGTMDMTLEVSDRKPRRIGFGAEYSTLEGVALTAFWMHRNIFGGAERLRFDGSISNIGTAESGVDYSISGRLDIPAIYGADTNGYLTASLTREDEPTYISNRAEAEVGVTRVLNDRYTAELGLGLSFSRTEDDLGTRDFLLVTLPATLTYDVRSNELNPRQGYYATATATPFGGITGTESGLKFDLDARAYLGFGKGDPSVAAFRLQLGSVVGPDVESAPPDFLYTSGGGGTVRGQPYQSLSVDLGQGDKIGGRSFLGLSSEFRQDVTDAIGVVAFYDAGYIGAESFYDGSGEWHAGAGLGLRYQTGIGPIRFDVATPVGGETGDGVQIYIGIGQAF